MEKIIAIDAKLKEDTNDHISVSNQITIILIIIIDE